MIDWLHTLVVGVYLGGMGCGLLVCLLVIAGYIWLRRNFDDTKR